MIGTKRENKVGTPMKEYDKDQELEEIMHAYGDELMNSHLWKFKSKEG
jgi:hypothetical protein